MNKATSPETKVDRYKREMEQWKESMPEFVEAYHHFTGTGFQAGELDEKQKHLIALGISLFAGNETCIQYHAQEAVSAGASRGELREAATAAAAAGSGQLMATASSGMAEFIGGR